MTMESFLFSGLFDLSPWAVAGITLLLTHVTIVSVTIFLHRHQAHHALDLHPITSHFFRFWLWLTTGMVTREWAAVHRKHHAKCDTPEDPHSPQILGLNRVLWGGVFLYIKEARKPETLARYGHGTPDDWLERHVYAGHPMLGMTLMGVIDVALFGVLPGALVLLTQIVWIPFWAAGVINGIGHTWGYRHWATADASRNIAPWGVVVGGEELHNNHHAYPTSAKLSSKWYEFDIGWLYIRVLEVLHLAKVKHLAPMPHFAEPKPVPDPQTLQAVIACRHDVLARYGKSLKRAVADEMIYLREVAPAQARRLRGVKRWLNQDDRIVPEPVRRNLAEVLPKSRVLATMLSMRHDLAALWGRSAATREQLVKQLQDWCERAEVSGIAPLQEFSQRLRRYA
jgi:stearoyl-CoA desaturase (Delta-9 desaturase)